MSKLKIVTDKPKTEFTLDELVAMVETGPFEAAEAVVRIMSKVVMPEAEKGLVLQTVTMLLMQLLMERGVDARTLMAHFEACVTGKGGEA